MKMKKYIAQTMPEAMKKVKNDLGDDAVVVSSKVIYTKGFLGLFKKKQFEVLAGVDAVEVADTRPDLDVFEKQRDFEEKYALSQQNEAIQKQLNELKKMIKQTSVQQTVNHIPAIIHPIYMHLQKQELNEELITEICDELFDIVRNEPVTTYEQLLMHAQESMYKKLSKYPMGGVNFERKFVNILGPTGVGKTTTIAKIAARAVLEKKKKVAFITTDTYRIGAIEQLKTYANLLHAPVEVVYTKEDYERAIKQFSGHDLVLIDTAGRNYKEAKFIADLEELIDTKQNVQNYLVLALTAKQLDMAMIIEQFSTFDIQQVIFTKMDETNTIGSMVNLMVKYNKGLAYYTDGQEVPENIEEGSVSKLVELIFQGVES